MKALVPLLALLAACSSSSDCTFDENPRCIDDHTLGVCPHGDFGGGLDPQITRVPCTGANPSCVSTGEKSAVCSASSTPSSACPGSGDVTICEGETLSSCQSGFLVHGSTCDTGCIRSTCAICDPGGAVADPGCANEAHSSCGDNSVRTCECGFSFKPVGCDAGLFCVTGDDVDSRLAATCALSQQPDPKCQSMIQRAEPTFCDGATLVKCSNGFQIERFACAVSCHDSGDGEAICGS